MRFHKTLKVETMKGFKPFKQQSIEEYLDDYRTIREQVIPAFYELFESGENEPAAYRLVRDALEKVSLFNLDQNSNALQVFLAETRVVGPVKHAKNSVSLLEAIQPDLLESKFDWRRSGETLRNLTKTTNRDTKRAAELAARGPEAPKWKWSDLPTYAELGFINGGEWQTRWRRGKDGKQFTQPVVWGNSLPDYKGAPPERSTRITAKNQLDSYKVEVWHGGVIQVTYRITHESGEETIYDSLCFVAQESGLKYFQVVSLLRKALVRADLGLDGSFFPEQLVRAAELNGSLCDNPLGLVRDPPCAPKSPYTTENEGGGYDEYTVSLGGR